MPIGALILLVEISVLVVIWFVVLCWFVMARETTDKDQPNYSDDYCG